MLEQTLRRIAWASIVVALSGTPARASEGVSGDAVRAHVAAFKQHPIVIIGEAHWLGQAGEFLRSLGRDPEFQQTVQDIVIEFASRNNQPLLIKYIAGENFQSRRAMDMAGHDQSGVLGVADLRGVVRRFAKSTKPSPPPRRLRVLAGDTAIDWSQIKTHSRMGSARGQQHFHRECSYK